MNRKLISLWLASIMLTALAACGQQSPQGDNAEKDYEIKIIDDGKAVEIIRYKGKEKDVQIPSHIRNLPVTAIGYEKRYSWLAKIPILKRYSRNKGAFEGKQLTSVVIPEVV